MIVIGVGTIGKRYKTMTEQELEDIMNKAFLEVLRPGQAVDKTISLSGGLDSTLIASILKNNNVSATSCSWENKDTDLSTTRQGMFDESVLAEKTCEQFNMKFNKSIVPRDFNPIMNEAYQALGLPIWDSLRFPYCLGFSYINSFI